MAEIYVEKAYYENGNVEMEIPFKDNIVHGIVKYYDENGNLESEMPYNIGELHGIARSYYKNGNLKAKRHAKTIKHKVLQDSTIKMVI